LDRKILINHSVWYRLHFLGYY